MDAKAPAGFARTSLHRRWQGGGESNSLGRSRGGFSSKINARTNFEGLPIGIVITPGQARDVTAVPALMNDIDCNPEQMLGDKGYDSEAVREDSNAVVKPRSQVSRPERYNIQSTKPFMHCATASSGSSIVPRTHAASPSRYDKLIESFAAFVLLASIRVWIKFVHTT